MKVTNSGDNVRRTNLRIEVRVSAYDMAVHLVNKWKNSSACKFTNQIKDTETIEERDARVIDQAETIFNRVSDATILKAIKDSISSYGEENPEYHISDEGYSFVVDHLTPMIAKRFGF